MARFPAVLRTFALALLLAFAMGTAPTLTSAAGAQEYQYDTYLPDGRAPAGVLGSHTLQKGQIEARYDLNTIDADGLLLGDLALTFEEALELFPEVPAAMDGLSQGFTLLYGATDRLTLMGHIRYYQRDLGHWTRDNEAFYTQSSSIGDLVLSGMYSVYDKGPYRAHVDAGVSLPTGSIDQVDMTPQSFPIEGQLPYVMQTGSGTFDVLPGLTLNVQNEHGSVGGQIRGTLRFGENDRGYRFGDRMMGSVWFAPRINDFVGVSARVVFENWDGVSGTDAALDQTQVPTAVAAFTGGSRAEVPFGLNFLMSDGMLQGHRVAVEVSFPIHQDYDGIQLERNTTMIFSWQKVF